MKYTIKTLNWESPLGDVILGKTHSVDIIAPPQSYLKDLYSWTPKNTVPEQLMGNFLFVESDTDKFLISADTIESITETATGKQMKVTHVNLGVLEVSEKELE